MDERTTQLVLRELVKLLPEGTVDRLREAECTAGRHYWREHRTFVLSDITCDWCGVSLNKLCTHGKDTACTKCRYQALGCSKIE